jgi:hypothetical protein
LWKEKSEGEIFSGCPRVNPKERAAGVHCLATAKAKMTDWRKPRELVETLLFLSRGLINACYVLIRFNAFHIGQSKREFVDIRV